MRKVLLLAAAAMMIPGAVSAQSTMNDPAASQPDTSGTTNAQPGTGESADPMASDTQMQPSDPMSNSASTPSSSADSASSAPMAPDASMPAGSSTIGTAADTSSPAVGAPSSSGDAMNKTYTMCSPTVTDSCRNRGGK